MAEPSHLLFNYDYGGGPLFKNQNDLVLQLLNHAASSYYEKDKNTEEYVRALNRLKIYVSQLLSSNVNRNITEDFRSSFTQLVRERLKGLKFDAVAISEEIIQGLKQKNIPHDKADNKSHLLDQAYEDLWAANYIAVITSRPLEISKDIEIKPFSFQRFLISDLYQSFEVPSKNLRFYRFNFPMEQYGELFWKGLKKVIRTFIVVNQHKTSLHESLYTNYYISHEKLKPLKKKSQISNDELEDIADGILYYLNRNRHVLVFIVKLPIYSMSLIALDPDDPSHAKIYAIFDSSGRAATLFKFAKEDYLLWRLFVWDKLKTEKSIVPLKYETRPFE
jgi:hypothetical protein